MRFNLAATGGTFDRFHKGHAALLRKAFSSADRVIIGLTTDEFAGLKRKKWRKIIEQYRTRLRVLKNFLKRHGWLRRALIAPLNDVAGPALFTDGVDCIVCSTETAAGAMKVNAMRNKKGLRQLPVVVCSLVLSEDELPISSTRMRCGEINRVGKLFFDARLFPHQRRITPNLVKLLRKPFGKLFTEPNAARKALHIVSSPLVTKTIFVGDVVVQKFAALGFKPNVAVVDYKTKRKKIFYDYHAALAPKMVLQATNPAHRLSQNLAGLLKTALENQRVLIEVKGEEDLLVLPAVLATPLESLVVYGQPDKGLVVIRVTEPVKARAKKIVEKFAFK